LTTLKIYLIQNFLLLSKHFMWLYFSVFIVTMFIPVRIWNLKEMWNVKFRMFTSVRNCECGWCEAHSCTLRWCRRTTNEFVADLFVYFVDTQLLCAEVT